MFFDQFYIYYTIKTVLSKIENVGNLLRSFCSVICEINKNYLMSNSFLTLKPLANFFN